MTSSVHHMPKRWHTMQQSPTAKARAVFIAYKNGEHTVLNHQQAQCDLLALIDGRLFTLNDYLLWCKRLNDVDNGAPITASFKGSPNYKPVAW